TRHDPWPVDGQFPVDDVQIGAADTAGVDADEHLVGLRLRDRALGQREVPGLRARRPRLHCRPAIVAASAAAPRAGAPATTIMAVLLVVCSRRWRSTMSAPLGGSDAVSVIQSTT